MKRTLLIVAGMLGASGPVLMDSAVKGTALLVVAAIASLTLRRDSAATRHLVWLLAMAAMLVVPVLSAILPRWRVLPEWVRIPSAMAVVLTRPPAMARPADGAMERARPAVPEDVASPSASAYQPAVRPPDSRPASAAASRSWLDAVTPVWALGSCAHPAAPGLAPDAREDRAAWDGHRIVRASVADSPSHRKCPGSRVLAAQDRATGHLVDSPGPDHSAGLGHPSISPDASRRRRAMGRRATAIGPAARAGPHQASRHHGSTAGADRVCHALVQSPGVAGRLASGGGV